MSFLDHVRAALTRLGVPAGGTVVAVSGGADSVALLHALLRLRDASALSRIVVAHLNHRLRGAESDADEQFVRDLVARLAAEGHAQLDCRCRRLDIAGLARDEGDNLEAVARRERYAWLTAIAKEVSLARVATGHTADDQAETVLHRLLRGTGLQGLRGIAPRRPLAPGIEVIRPLLSVSRPEILAFLAEIGQPFREDRSNTDLRFTRNRIRHELLPLLANQYNPAIRSVLARLAEQAAGIFQETERRARDLLAASELPPAGSLHILDRTKLQDAPRDLLREMLRQLWQREGWPRDRLRFDDWDRIAGVALGELPAVDLPGGITVRGRERVVQVGRA